MAADSPSTEEAIDVAAVLARLRAEVEQKGRAEDRAPGPTSPDFVARAEAERLWAVSADRPYLYKPGLVGRVRGLALLPVKAVLRRLLRWYVEPLAVDQRAFNGAALRALDELSERFGSELERVATSLQRDSGARFEELEVQVRERSTRLLAELEERVYRLERRRHSVAPNAAAAPVTPHADEPAAPPFDYFSLEMRIRGPRADVRERQRVYVESFRDAAPVLDVGAGRGEFLELLRDAGITASGIELDPELVEYGRSQGLSVDHGDAVGYLAGLENGSLGGIFAAQVVEHLPPPPLVRFLELAAQKLRSGGLLVAETINPLTLVALKHYFADPTHAQPLVPQTLEVLARQAGFGRTELRYLNELPDRERLRSVDLPPGPEFEDARKALAANVELLNTVLFGPQDYALYAWA